MTENIKATRLSKAARKFNVGISTIVEFLNKNGFDLDPNPNTKLPDEAYNLLVKEYSTDISVKKESERLSLKDITKKKESVSIDDFAEKNSAEDVEHVEEVILKDSSITKKDVDIKTEIAKPDIKLVGKIDLDETTRPKIEKAAPPKEVKEEKVTPKPDEPEKTALEKEEKKGPPINIHIVGKIDLETTSKEGKSLAEEVLSKQPEEKIAEQKEETAESEIKTTSEVQEPLTLPAEEEKLIDVPQIVEPEEEIFKVFRPDIEKLSGPTVVGKIDLPVEEKKKQAPNQPVKIDPDSDGKRKKRRKGSQRKGSGLCCQT